MRIGLLLTDHVRAELRPVHGDYPELFGALFRAADPGVEIVVHDVVEGPPPEDTGAVDLFVMTGSAASVYDDLPWIAALSAFVRRLHAERRKLFAVCFGHQLVAHTLGGRTAKATVGWGVGVRRARIVSPRPWMGDVHHYDLIMSHQDQVVALPEDATLLATSDYCPIQAFTLGDHILTVQGHPELTSAYAADLLRLRRDLVGPAQVDAALATLDRPRDDVQWARWALAFARS